MEPGNSCTDPFDACFLPVTAGPPASLHPFVFPLTRCLPFNKQVRHLMKNCDALFVAVMPDFNVCCTSDRWVFLIIRTWVAVQYSWEEESCCSRKMVRILLAFREVKLSYLWSREGCHGEALGVSVKGETVALSGRRQMVSSVP